MELPKKFASLVLDARERRGLTQSEVAELVGISPRWFQKIESGASLPGTAVAIRLMLALAIDVKELRREAGFGESVQNDRENA